MRAAIFLLLIITSATTARAETNLVPSMNARSDICPDRPSEPNWMQTIPLREAYKRVLVQDIHRAQSLERVVAEETCACKTRFPAWDAAVAEFHEKFTNATRWEMLEASQIYNRRSNDLRPAAKTNCDAVGNW